MAQVSPIQHPYHRTQSSLRPRGHPVPREPTTVEQVVILAYDHAEIPEHLRIYGREPDGSDTPMWSMVHYLKYGFHTMSSMDMYDLERLHWAWAVANGYKYGPMRPINVAGYMDMPRTLTPETRWEFIFTRDPAVYAQDLPAPDPLLALYYYSTPKPDTRAPYYLFALTQPSRNGSRRMTVLRDTGGYDETRLWVDEILSSVSCELLALLPDMSTGPEFNRKYIDLMDRHFRTGFLDLRISTLHMVWRETNVGVTIRKYYPGYLDIGETIPSSLLRDVPGDLLYGIYDVAVFQDAVANIPVPDVVNVIGDHFHTDTQTRCVVSMNDLAGQYHVVVEPPVVEVSSDEDDGEMFFSSDNDVQESVRELNELLAGLGYSLTVTRAN